MAAITQKIQCLSSEAQGCDVFRNQFRNPKKSNLNRAFVAFQLTYLKRKNKAKITCF